MRKQQGAIFLLREYTACFTGHRSLDEDCYALKKKLVKILRQLIKDGIFNFVTGGALGFDTFAALTVLELKNEYPQLTLTVISPFSGQANSFGKIEKMMFEDIKNRSDNFIILRMAYCHGCMHERNKAMVDLSSVCIAYLKREKTGTAQTVQYAQRQGLKVINLAEEHSQLSLF
ncbi:MAG: SLOG family protein [Oscillospiraceae bacterium]